MIKNVLLLAVLCCTAYGGYGRDAGPEQKDFGVKEVSEPLRIEVCFNLTVHVLFPAPVTYVDLGSMNIIAGKADGAENVVRVKAAVRDFEGETNFSVICANGCLYTFVVTYSDEPSRLSVEIGDNAIPAAGRDDPDKRPFVRLNELGEQTPAAVGRIMAAIYQNDVRDIKTVGSKKYGIQAVFKGIYISGDLMYFHAAVRNFSNIPFDIDYIRFVISDKKVTKRTAIQQTIIEPVRVFDQVTSIDGKSTVRNVYVFRKITIPDDKILRIEVCERGGGRHLRFTVDNTDLVRAKPVDLSKIK